MKETKQILTRFEYKAAEAVHLGSNFIYMRYKSLKEGVAEYKNLEAAGFISCCQYVKDTKYVFRFVLTKEQTERIKAFVLPTLPKNWFTVRQPWQAL